MLTFIVIILLFVGISTMCAVFAYRSQSQSDYEFFSGLSFLCSIIAFIGVVLMMFVL